MKKAVLLGTSHPVQRGNDQKDNFQSYIMQLCSNHKVNAVAQEIDKFQSVAADISDKLDITHKIIEPTPDERVDLGIEEVGHIQWELMPKAEIENWPDEPSAENLPHAIYEEYTARTQTTYRQRESEWLRGINELDTWPVLIICGADHYKHFCELLFQKDIDVVKEQNKWGICQDA